MGFGTPFLECLGIKKKDKNRNGSRTSQQPERQPTSSYTVKITPVEGSSESKFTQSANSHKRVEEEKSLLGVKKTVEQQRDDRQPQKCKSKYDNDQYHCSESKELLPKIEENLVAQSTTDVDNKDECASHIDTTDEVNNTTSQVQSPTGTVNKSVHHCTCCERNQSLSFTELTEVPTSPKTDDVFYDDNVDGENQVHKRGIGKITRGVRMNKTDLKVKYTKLHGENDGAYRNDSTPRGLVFMVNFTNYEGKNQLEREGSLKDYQNLLNLFQQMGYETTRRTDKYCHSGYMTRDTFLSKVKDFSQDKRHRMLCSCVFIIMSHGSGPKTFVTSDNQEVNLMEIYGMLDNINCQYLQGKPKIFILQFCRNSRNTRSDSQCLTPSLQQSLRLLIREELQIALHEQNEAICDNGEQVPKFDLRSPRFQDILERSENASISSLSSYIDQHNEESSCFSFSGVETPDTTGLKIYQTDTKHIPSPPPAEGIQRFSDMYSIFSTPSGELSHRDPRKGSLLIQAICHVFAEFAYHDEIDILVRKVSLYMTKTLQKDDPIHVPRQTCERTNNGLDKYFYFNPEHIPQFRYTTI